MTVDPRVAQYRRQAAMVTHVEVLSPEEKREHLALIGKGHPWSRGRARERSAELENQWRDQESRAATEALVVVGRFEEAIFAMERSLDRLMELSPEHLQGKVTDERGRLIRARTGIAEARSAIQERDFGLAGKLLNDVDKLLWSFGGPLVVALNDELRTAAYSREVHEALADNQARRQAARHEVEMVRRSQGGPEALLASVDPNLLMADGLSIIADILGQQQTESAGAATESRVADNILRVVPPHELERLDEVGGLDDVKDMLRRSISVHLQQRDAASDYGVGQNSVLLYGPPGTGKTLLARAVAGEFGLRYIRVTPSTIASPYAHETARNLTRVFAAARQQAPALIFLDEIDALASARSGLPSAEHREVVSQLLTLLEEHAGVRGMVIMGATNAIELLDTALREGRFDLRLPVPMPDSASRRGILDIHLRRRERAVDWQDIDLDAVVARTAAYSGAALGALVRLAAERALAMGGKITTAQLMGALEDRQARDRTVLEDAVHWDDVVLPAGLEKRLQELMEVVQHPELAEAVGIAPPLGVLLYGPPGTGKTTIAKALATEVRASFYEMSAADLLSKWVGESEQKVQKLFETARNNRPSIIFIDEIDALLKRRSASSVAPWEERVVSQFLRELDGLRAATGVFLVGATNRLDIIDEAVKDRRLTPLEVPVPDREGRERLLEKLFARVKLAAGVDLHEFARATDGFSGADLKRLRDEVGMKALHRGLREGRPAHQMIIDAADFYESLRDRTTAVIPD